MTQLVLFHVSAAAGLGAVGSPLYDVYPEHIGALVAVAVLPLLAWFLRRRAAAGDGLAARLVEAHRALPAARRFLVWLLASSAVIHLALAIGHGGLVLSLAFLADAALLALVARRLVLGRTWRARAALVLLGSIAGWWVSMAAGEFPYQVGLVTKLVEATALALVVRPVSRGRLRAFAASAAAVTVVVAGCTAPTSMRPTLSTRATAGCSIPSGPRRWSTHIRRRGRSCSGPCS
ncbi:MAG: hypothetical protein ACT4PO_13965 [Actinomycetota bacterium]